MLAEIKELVQANPINMKGGKPASSEDLKAILDRLAVYDRSYNEQNDIGLIFEKLTNEYPRGAPDYEKIELPIALREIEDIYN